MLTEKEQKAVRSSQRLGKLCLILGILLLGISLPIAENVGKYFTDNERETLEFANTLYDNIIPITDTEKRLKKTLQETGSSNMTRLDIAKNNYKIMVLLSQIIIALLLIVIWFENKFYANKIEK